MKRGADELERVLALSLIEHQQQQRHEEELSRAVATSLAEAEPEPPKRRRGEWDCTRCTRRNESDTGRCASCLFDRVAPFASANATPVTESRCGLSGCSRPRLIREYCSVEHERRALTGRMAAPTDPGTDRVWYGASGDHAYHHLTKKDAAREDVRQRFLEHWGKDEAGAGFIERPTVERLFRVTPSPQLREAHERYALLVGNRRQRFHGTGAKCGFGIDQNTPPCGDAACALCSIAAQGFRLSRRGSGPNFARASFATSSGLRFGPGLYFSATSGKSHDYAGGSELVRQGRRWRTMFLASVAAGKAHLELGESLDIERPPAGHDSVVGETKAKGGSLNYDELVVYEEQAALPQYLIVYSLPMG